MATGGTYQGDETVCAEAGCVAPCPGDFNDDGVADLLALLTVWGACF